MKGNVIKLVKKARRGVLGAMPARLLLGAAIMPPKGTFGMPLRHAS